MKFKVGDVVVSKFADVDIEVGERFTVTDVTYGGDFINFIDKVGDLRERPSHEFKLVVKTLADVEVKEGMRFKVNLAGVCPIQLAEDIKVQVEGTDGEVLYDGLMVHGYIGVVYSTWEDGDISSNGKFINPVLFKYLELVEPKELVKGKWYMVKGYYQHFLGVDASGSYLFNISGLTHAVADKSSVIDFVRAQQSEITFLSEDEAMQLEEA